MADADNRYYAMKTARAAFAKVMAELEKAQAAIDKDNPELALGYLLDRDKDIKVVITILRVAKSV